MSTKTTLFFIQALLCSYLGAPIDYSTCGSDKQAANDDQVSLQSPVAEVLPSGFVTSSASTPTKGLTQEFIFSGLGESDKSTMSTKTTLFFIQALLCSYLGAPIDYSTCGSDKQAANDDQVSLQSPVAEVLPSGFVTSSASTPTKGLTQEFIFSGLGESDKSTMSTKTTLFFIQALLCSYLGAPIDYSTCGSDKQAANDDQVSLQSPVAEVLPSGFVTSSASTPTKGLTQEFIFSGLGESDKSTMSTKTTLFFIQALLCSYLGAPIDYSTCGSDKQAANDDQVSLQSPVAEVLPSGFVTSSASTPTKGLTQEFIFSGLGESDKSTMSTKTTLFFIQALLCSYLGAPIDYSTYGSDKQAANDDQVSLQSPVAEVLPSGFVTSSASTPTKGLTQEFIFSGLGESDKSTMSTKTTLFFIQALLCSYLGAPIDYSTCGSDKQAANDDQVSLQSPVAEVLPSGFVTSSASTPTKGLTQEFIFSGLGESDKSTMSTKTTLFFIQALLCSYLGAPIDYSTCGSDKQAANDDQVSLQSPVAEVLPSGFVTSSASTPTKGLTQEFIFSGLGESDKSTMSTKTTLFFIQALLCSYLGAPIDYSTCGSDKQAANDDQVSLQSPVAEVLPSGFVTSSASTPTKGLTQEFIFSGLGESDKSTMSTKTTLFFIQALLCSYLGAPIDYSTSGSDKQAANDDQVSLQSPVAEVLPSGFVTSSASTPTKGLTQEFIFSGLGESDKSTMSTKTTLFFIQALLCSYLGAPIDYSTYGSDKQAANDDQVSLQSPVAEVLPSGFVTSSASTPTKGLTQEFIFSGLGESDKSTMSTKTTLFFIQALLCSYLGAPIDYSTCGSNKQAANDDQVSLQSPVAEVLPSGFVTSSASTPTKGLTQEFIFSGLGESDKSTMSTKTTLFFIQALLCSYLGAPIDYSTYGSDKQAANDDQVSLQSPVAEVLPSGFVTSSASTPTKGLTQEFIFSGLGESDKSTMSTKTTLFFIQALLCSYLGAPIDYSTCGSDKQAANDDQVSLQSPVAEVLPSGFVTSSASTPTKGLTQEFIFSGLGESDKSTMSTKTTLFFIQALLCSYLGAPIDYSTCGSDKQAANDDQVSLQSPVAEVLPSGFVTSSASTPTKGLTQEFIFSGLGESDKSTMSTKTTLFFIQALLCSYLGAPIDYSTCGSDKQAANDDQVSLQSPVAEVLPSGFVTSSASTPTKGLTQEFIFSGLGESDKSTMSTKTTLFFIQALLCSYLGAPIDYSTCGSDKQAANDDQVSLQSPVAEVLPSGFVTSSASTPTKGLTQEFIFSGLGESDKSTMSTKTTLFFIQALLCSYLGAPIDYSTCGSDKQAANDDQVSLQSPVAEVLPSGFVTSSASTPTKGLTQEFIFSGLGESDKSTMSTKTTLFFIQALLCSYLGAPIDYSTCGSDKQAANDDQVSLQSPVAEVLPSGFVTSSASTPTKGLTQEFIFSGLGESDKSTMSTKTTLFFIQVGHKTSLFASNTLMLIVVPCPQTCIDIAYDCFYACKLLVCGDVETNPGPTTEEMFQQIMNGQSAIHKEITELKTQQSKTEVMISGINARFVEFDQILHELRQKTERVQALESSLVNLERTVLFQTQKITDLEDRSRRSNLVVYGIAETEDETEAQLKSKVITEVLNGILGVTCTSISRIHRLGKPSDKRPVILFFQDYNEKQAILRNAKKLKNTRISICNDYSPSTLAKRRALWLSAKTDKDQGKKVFLVHDKLRINDDWYIWDDVANSRVQLPQLQPRSNE
ncbi:uncharacterized protein ISCGN_020823 [Ixodes scapularis]